LAPRAADITVTQGLSVRRQQKEADFWRGRKVLLTGHTGFKGAWMLLWLRNMGAEVTGYALQPSTEPNLWAIVGSGARSIIGDIRDAAGVHDLMTETKPSIVIHMAAQALVRPSYVEPVETFATNVMGTVHLLEAARHLPSGNRAAATHGTQAGIQINESFLAMKVFELSKAFPADERFALTSQIRRSSRST